MQEVCCDILKSVALGAVILQKGDYHGGGVSMQPAESILAKLKSDTAGHWQAVGKVLLDLEGISGVSRSGETWPEVIVERLAALGHPVSQGHLYKVRRGFAFAARALHHLGLPEEVLERAKIGAVDLAERLYRLDADAGYSALKACVDEQSPATASDIKKLYDRFLESHPERRNPKQVAWVERKKHTAQDAKLATDDSAAASGDDVPKVGSPEDNAPVDLWPDAKPWLPALQPVIMRLRDLEEDIRARDEHIRLLEEENEELRRAVREARQHEQILSDELRDASARLLGSVR